MALGCTRGNPLHQDRNNAVALIKWLRSRVGSYDNWVRGLLVFTMISAILSNS